MTAFKAVNFQNFQVLESKEYQLVVKVAWNLEFSLADVTELAVLN